MFRFIPEKWIWVIGHFMDERFRRSYEALRPRFRVLLGLRFKMWLRRARTALEYRPGGPGYLRARESFQVRAGQRRATRRYRPY